MTSPADHWHEIEEQAQAYKLDPFLVAAVVMVESSGDEWTSRFEKKQYLEAIGILPDVKIKPITPKAYAKRLGISEDTEIAHQFTSWGPMHVMGYVARELGHIDHLPALSIASFGLGIGCKKLSILFRKHGAANVKAVLSAYNRGTPKYTKEGKFVNQDYVDKVTAFADLYTRKGVK